MDELSTQEQRGAAFAANLRRAYGAAVEGDLPSVFARLLQRLDDPRSASPLPVTPSRDPYRLGS